MDRLKKRIPVLLLATFCFLLAPLSVYALEATTDASSEEEVAQAPQTQSMGGHGSFLLGNRVIERGNQSTNHITNSGNDNRGIVSVNQASGSFNNQRNIRAFVFPTDPQGVSVLSVGSPSAILANKVDACGVVRKDVINNSFNETCGIVGVNQSSGNMVIQENAVAIGVGKGLILSEMELGAVCIKENDVTTDKVWREDKIIDSFNDIRGVVQVNQTSGDAIVSKNYLGYTFSNLEAP